MAGQSQQRQERAMERELRQLALLHRFRPHEDDDTVQRGLDDEEDLSDGILMVLPEELRPMVWATTRGMQERTIAQWLDHHGGWRQDHPPMARSHDLEPLDQLKALACILDHKPLPLLPDGSLSPASQQRLDTLGHHTASPWQPLSQLAIVCGVLSPRRDQHLIPQNHSLPLLDEDSLAWACTCLRHFVSGTSTLSLDRAQNLAFGLSQEWLDHVKSAHQRIRHQSMNLEDWWCHLSHPPPGQPTPQLARTARHRTRPIPTWLSAPGLVSDSDVWCGCPRRPDERPQLPEEHLLVEDIFTTFRLLILDLLCGLKPGVLIAMGDFTAFLQDTASMAVQLHLAVFGFDPTQTLSIPVRPPTWLADHGALDSFSELAQTLLDTLLIPSGVAQAHPHGFLLRSDRIEVATPSWVAHRGRLDALAGILDMDPDALDLRRASRATLRAIHTADGESEHRIWLGRPMRELKLALQGRSIIALHGAYLELDS